MPWLTGFAGPGQLREARRRRPLLALARLTLIYTGATVVLQVAVGLGLALLVMQVKLRQALLRVGGDPADRARARGRRSLLALAGAGAGLRRHRLPHARARPGQLQLARRPAARAGLGDRDPHLAVDAVRLPRAAREPGRAAARHLRGGAPRPRGAVAALPAHHPADASARRSSSWSSCAW